MPNCSRIVLYKARSSQLILGSWFHNIPNLYCELSVYFLLTCFDRVYLEMLPSRRLLLVVWTCCFDGSLDLRFFETNTTVNLKCLEFLQAAFKMLTRDGNYRMTDYEANAFLPYLVTKVLLYVVCTYVLLFL